VEYRLLGRTGLKVSALSFGAMTFGGKSGFGELVGATLGEDADAQVKACLDAGVNLFDTADVYSRGQSETVLGAALKGVRDEVLIATKAFGRMGRGVNDLGASRHHIVNGVEASLRRLGTDHIDLYQLHGFDAQTPLEETLRALDDLVRSGKVRYIGCSNYSAWHLMKALGLSDAHDWERFASQQVYYSLIGRDIEHELVPLGLDQGVGGLIWSPLASGWLSGKFRRDSGAPDGSRGATTGIPGDVDAERAYDVVEVLDEISAAHEGDGATPAQVALNWVLAKAGVTSVIVGARTLTQLQDNLAAATWSLTAEEIRRLDEVSATPLPYPNWHQSQYAAERATP
jgi:aryl-alcohol dehydrogenase-like predicted oxidoreductase